MNPDESEAEKRPPSAGVADPTGAAASPSSEASAATAGAAAESEAEGDPERDPDEEITRPGAEPLSLAVDLDAKFPFDDEEVTNRAPSPFTMTMDFAGTDPDPAAPDYTRTSPGMASPDFAPADSATDGAAETGDAAEPSAASRLPSILESLLLAADRPLPVADLAALVGERDHDRVEATLVQIALEWEARGINLHPIAGGWQLRTNPKNALWVQKLLSNKPVRLTRAQLETLAIIGYRQPITRPEIDEIRGVDSGGTLKTLLDRSLVRILGKKEEPGRPLLYGTTKEFLEFFNLRDLKDLPTLREYHELSEEHLAQVAALEQAAPPGAIEPDPGVPAGLSRVDLPDVPEEDMSNIDAMIDQAGDRAKAAAKALGVDEKPVPPPAETIEPPDLGGSGGGAT